MAILFKSENPSKLLSAFRQAIDDGRVVTWSYDADGDFTHNTDQWRRKAWLRPEVGNGLLTMHIVGPKGTKITTEIYAIYHGRFTESMLVHCDKLFSMSSSTAQATTGDLI